MFAKDVHSKPDREAATDTSCCREKPKARAEPKAKASGCGCSESKPKADTEQSCCK